MNIWKMIFGGGNPIKDAGDALDKVFTSDDERLKGQAVLKDLESQLTLGLQKFSTDVWKADMASDSWLSKNIRPMTWLLMTLLLIGVVGTDKWVAFDPAIVNLVKTGWMTITTLYVPARMIDKGLVNWQKK